MSTEKMLNGGITELLSSSSASTRAGGGSPDQTWRLQLHVGDVHAHTSQPWTEAVDTCEG